MTRKLINIILIAALVTLACDEKFIIVNCNDCLLDEPIDADIEVTLDKNGGTNAILNVYEGKIEDNKLLRTYYASGKVINITLKLNIKYTFSAHYTDNSGVEFLVIDSLFPQVKYETYQCEEPCFYVYNRKIKLKLKYNRNF